MTIPEGSRWIRLGLGTLLDEMAAVHRMIAVLSTKSLRRSLVGFIATTAVAVVFFLGVMQGLNTSRSMRYVPVESSLDTPPPAYGPVFRRGRPVLASKGTRYLYSKRRSKLEPTLLQVSSVNEHTRRPSQWSSTDNPSFFRREEIRAKVASGNNHTPNVQITRSIRNHTIQSICQAEQIGDISLLDSGARESLTHQIIVDDERKFLYCYVPKVACSNWKRVIKFMQGTIEDIGAKFKMDHKNGLVFLDSFSEEEIKYRIKNYFKFMFVRNPLERLLSAFRNKFGEDAINVYKERYAPAIIRRYRGEWDGKSKNITLEEFVRFLLDSRTTKMDQHWRPMHLLCQPCAVQYDFVGSFEQLNEDADYVLDKIKGNTGAYFPPRQEWYNPTTQDKIEALLSSVNPVYVQEYVDKFILDFITFGYAPPKQYYLKYNQDETENTSENDIEPRTSEDS